MFESRMILYSIVVFFCVGPCLSQQEVAPGFMQSALLDKSISPGPFNLSFSNDRGVFQATGFLRNTAPIHVASKSDLTLSHFLENEHLYVCDGDIYGASCTNDHCTLSEVDPLSLFSDLSLDYTAEFPWSVSLNYDADNQHADEMYSFDELPILEIGPFAGIDSIASIILDYSELDGITRIGVRHEVTLNFGLNFELSGKKLSREWSHRLFSVLAKDYVIFVGQIPIQMQLFLDMTVFANLDLDDLSFTADVVSLNRKFVRELFWTKGHGLSTNSETASLVPDLHHELSGTGILDIGFDLELKTGLRLVEFANLTLSYKPYFRFSLETECDRYFGLEFRFDLGASVTDIVQWILFWNVSFNSITLMDSNVYNHWIIDPCAEVPVRDVDHSKAFLVGVTLSTPASSLHDYFIRTPLKASEFCKVGPVCDTGTIFLTQGDLFEFDVLRRTHRGNNYVGSYEIWISEDGTGFLDDETNFITFLVQSGGIETFNPGNPLVPFERDPNSRFTVEVIPQISTIDEFFEYEIVNLVRNPLVNYHFVLTDFPQFSTALTTGLSHQYSFPAQAPYGRLQVTLSYRCTNTAGPFVLGVVQFYTTVALSSASSSPEGSHSTIVPWDGILTPQLPTFVLEEGSGWTRTRLVTLVPSSSDFLGFFSRTSESCTLTVNATLPSISISGLSSTGYFPPLVVTRSMDCFQSEYVYHSLLCRKQISSGLFYKAPLYPLLFPAITNQLVLVTGAWMNIETYKRSTHNGGLIVTEGSTIVAVHDQQTQIIFLQKGDVGSSYLFNPDFLSLPLNFLYGWGFFPFQFPPKSTVTFGFPDNVQSLFFNSSSFTNDIPNFSSVERGYLTVTNSNPTYQDGLVIYFCHYRSFLERTCQTEAIPPPHIQYHLTSGQTLFLSLAYTSELAFLDNDFSCKISYRLYVDPGTVTAFTNSYEEFVLTSEGEFSLQTCHFTLTLSNDFSHNEFWASFTPILTIQPSSITLPAFSSCLVDLSSLEFAMSTPGYLMLRSSVANPTVRLQGSPMSGSNFAAVRADGFIPQIVVQTLEHSFSGKLVFSLNLKDRNIVSCSLSPPHYFSLGYRVNSLSGFVAFTSSHNFVEDAENEISNVFVESSRSILIEYEQPVIHSNLDFVDLKTTSNTEDSLSVQVLEYKEYLFFTGIVLDSYNETVAGAQVIINGDVDDDVSFYPLIAKVFSKWSCF
ncbi:hypothetical protein GEMRC1_012582 [Eukaryota sp. GEM-RC1]